MIRGFDNISRRDVSEDDALEHAEDIIQYYSGENPDVKLSWAQWQYLKNIIARGLRGLELDDHQERL